VPDFWIKISEDFMFKLAGLICTAALLWAARRLWHTISPFIFKPFSLTGIWIGLCEMPRYSAVEVYRIVVRKERAAFSFFSFRSDLAPAQRFVGSGISRGKFLSAFYYSPKAENQVSGVLSLQIGTAGDRLEGAFTQYTSGDSLLPDRKEFELTRIQVSFLCQLRMIFWQRPFHTFDEAFQIYEKATKPYHRPAAA
jgi:hypothetical protein